VTRQPPADVHALDATRELTGLVSGPNVFFRPVSCSFDPEIKETEQD